MTDRRFLLSAAPGVVLAFLVVTVAAGCRSGPPIPAGQIRVENETMDRSYNVIRVSGGGATYTLSPGEWADLGRGVRSFTLSRAYRDYTRSYSVSCPELKGRGIRIRMIDAHTNRLPGGCETTSASR